MESLGIKLKTAREEKGYSIDYVCRETNIAGRFIEALENEDFSVFPGEPYLLGFLKNYGAYLELDVNELLSLFRSYKIQEQPVPVDELFKTPSNAPRIFGRIAMVLVVLAAASCLVFFLLQNKSQAGETPSARVPAQYTMNADFMERRLYPGDTVLVPFGDIGYRFELSGIGDTVTFATPAGPLRLDLSQEASVDLVSDGSSSLLITVADFARNDVSSGALLRFDLRTTTAETEIMDIEENLPGSPVIVLFSSPNAFPFTLQAVFQGYCLFRWEILFESNRAGRNEQYFQNAEELNIQAQNGIRLGMSNAQAVKFQVIGGGRTVVLEAGGPGEVVVGDLRWLRDEENRFRLTFTRLE